MCYLVVVLGGDPAAIADLSKLPRARSTTVLEATGSGFVVGIDSEAIGLAARALGAGRETSKDQIDPAVGLVLEKKVRPDFIADLRGLLKKNVGLVEALWGPGEGTDVSLQLFDREGDLQKLMASYSV